MSSTGQTPEEVLKMINTIFYAISISIILFGVMGYYYIYAEDLAAFEQERQELYLFITLAVTVVAALAGNRIFQHKVGSIAPAMNRDEKLSIIRKAYIYQFGLIELAAVFAIVIAIVEGDPIYMILTAFMLALLLFKKPTEKKIAEYLKER